MKSEASIPFAFVALGGSIAKTKCRKSLVCSLNEKDEQGQFPAESRNQLQVNRRTILQFGASLATSALWAPNPATAAASALASVVPLGDTGLPLSLDHAERIFDTRIGSYLPPKPKQILPRHLTSEEDRLIFVGENHSNPLHHRIQLDIIKALYESDSSRPLAIGFEHFYRQHQRILDSFIRGRISLVQLRNLVHWDSMFGYEFKLWVPILQYACENSIPVLGLNVPGAVTELIAEGGLNSLPGALRELLPEVDLSNQPHYEHFVATIAGHHQLEGNMLKNYYEALSLWDEYMADSAAKFMTADSEFNAKRGRLVVLCGNAHVEGKFGVPDRVTKRTGLQTFTVVPKSVRMTDERLPDIERPDSRDVADWLWYLADRLP
mmetsp:Transcript_11170/g.19080  ORF Transcript_11170/g.19080 Transcript_11170/m.19080 type:complete len:379 (-) Transcript_11170:209-1345(-)|eukprot:CAMPEP_0184695856 /NCGR_PEP_ID=MMETSP0313-20130426/3353_1 /TAXON_ID=2792 /ORGANISM="Porphyridium aerugineum, Strain SAG 1380-2" /LENGTH=378 /DNA_ID=CAMNT_0027154383 /DNA_START=212 /DNA_END=1348 /DNA_ORIENTATION=+